MKSILTIILFIPILANSQSIDEICSTSITNGTVVDFESYDGNIYATGFFTTICGQSSDYIARWNNGTWEPSSFEISDPGHSLRVIDDLLYIAKYEESIDSNWVYTYDGIDLEKMGTGVYLTTASSFSELPNIYDIIEYNGEIYACGEFDRVGTEEISGIMKWNGSNWEDVGGGLTDNIQNSPPVLFPHAMHVFNGDLYVAGNFRNAGGIEVNGIAKWNGTEWSAMANGFNGTVYSVSDFNGELYAGGSFTMSGNTELNRIAKWNGTDWESIGFGFIPNSAQDFIFVHTLHLMDNKLFMGGGLKKILYEDNSEEICNGVVSFDGSILNTFNNGVPNNDIEAILETDDGIPIFGGGVFGNGYVGMISGVGLEEHGPNNIYIYPNPVEDFLSISSPIDIESIMLYDSSGKVIGADISNNTVDITHLKSGFYILNILTEQSVESISFIKN